MDDGNDDRFILHDVKDHIMVRHTLILNIKIIM